MNHHIAKPFDVAQLISTINEHIESRHTAEFFQLNRLALTAYQRREVKRCGNLELLIGFNG